jgi:glycosyltransferase involved in cell wall biosynthesis
MPSLDVALVVQNMVRQDGQGRVALELARALIARGHRLTVYAHRLDDDVAGAVTFTRIAPIRGPQLIDDLAMLASATWKIRRAHHDVVCTVGPCALSRGRVVFNPHFSHRAWRGTWTRSTRPAPYHRAYTRVLAAVETVCARRATLVLASTAPLARDIAPRRTDVAVVPQGVDLDEFAVVTNGERATARAALGIAPDRFVVAFVGDYATTRKGLEPLLQALTLGSDPRELLVVAGRGDDGAMRARIAALAISDRVRPVGFQPARAVIAAADAVVVPSLYEPFSLVALEAAACGVPVVATSAVGAAPLLGAGALVVPPGDADALRAAIDTLARDPDQRTQRGTAGRAAVADLAWDGCMRAAAIAIEAVARPEAAARPAGVAR